MPALPSTAAADPAATAPPGATPLPPQPPVQPVAPDDVVRWTRVLAVGSLLGLIVLGLAWELVLAPTGNRTLVLKVLPLAIPLAGLLKHRMYTYRWVSLLVWIYFTEGVVRAFGDTGVGAVLAMIEVVLCLVLFTACALHVRWRLLVVKRAADAAAARDRDAAAGRAA